MFTRPTKKRRGRKPPPYGIRACPWCQLLLHFNLKDQRYYCKCGWKE